RRQSTAGAAHRGAAQRGRVRARPTGLYRGHDQSRAVLARDGSPDVEGVSDRMGGRDVSGLRRLPPVGLCRLSLGRSRTASAPHRLRRPGRACSLSDGYGAGGGGVSQGPVALELTTTVLAVGSIVTSMYRELLSLDFSSHSAC